MTELNVSPSKINQEPIPELVNMMSFYDAMKRLASGFRIARFEWTDKTIYCVLQDGLVKIKLPGGINDWIISDGDLEGKDWLVV
jgi:hypothetical protein